MIFFIVGTGRCGTMSVAACLSDLPDIFCLHEGFIKVGPKKIKQVLPNMTLQNMNAYRKPSESKNIFNKSRKDMKLLFESNNIKKPIIGDSAYYYAPFVSHILSEYDSAKIIFLHRNCYDFVRSSTLKEPPDEFPIGWQDWHDDSKINKFIELGRLKPTNKIINQPWKTLKAIYKNAWLWKETNELILNGISKFPSQRYLNLSLDSLKNNFSETFDSMCDFLGSKYNSEDIKFSYKNINERIKKDLPLWSELETYKKDNIKLIADETMKKLGYEW